LTTESKAAISASLDQALDATFSITECDRKTDIENSEDIVDSQDTILDSASIVDLRKEPLLLPLSQEEARANPVKVTGIHIIC
jgi:hypothetical protein